MKAPGHRLVPAGTKAGESVSVCEERSVSGREGVKSFLHVASAPPSGLQVLSRCRGRSRRARQSNRKTSRDSLLLPTDHRRKYQKDDQYLFEAS